MAGTKLGQRLQSEELVKQTRKAFGALLAVAILQVLFGTLIFTTSNVPTVGAQPSRAEIGVVAGVVYGIGAIFFALALWARKNPLPAAITGLVVFVTVHLFDAVANPASLVQGIVVKIIVVVVLIRAISAGARHRTLLRQLNPT